MELDINDFELIVNRVGEVYLQYSIEPDKKKLNCLHLQKETVTRCTISKNKIKQGQFRYGPRSLLPKVVLSAHQRICLSKKPCQTAREIIVKMFHLLTDDSKGDAVQPDSCTPAEHSGRSNVQTSQAGATANG